jgi:predicted DNA repair protein MutK
VRDDEMVKVRSGLVCLYGAVAAVLRRDDLGRDLLLADVRDAFDDLGDVLVTISLATLERLEAAVMCRPVVGGDGGRPIAQEILRVAKEYEICDPSAVRSAAARLDGVRQGDRIRAAEDVREACELATEEDLVRGGTAVLAATVAVWARRSGQSPRRAATELCLVASLDALG